MSHRTERSWPLASSGQGRLGGHGAKYRVLTCQPNTTPFPFHSVTYFAFPNPQPTKGGGWDGSGRRGQRESRALALLIEVKLWVNAGQSLQRREDAKHLKPTPHCDRCQPRDLVDSPGPRKLRQSVEGESEDYGLLLLPQQVLLRMLQLSWQPSAARCCSGPEKEHPMEWLRYHLGTFSKPGTGRSGIRLMSRCISCCPHDSCCDGGRTCTWDPRHHTHTSPLGQ